MYNSSIQYGSIRAFLPLLYFWTWGYWDILELGLLGNFGLAGIRQVLAHFGLEALGHFRLYIKFSCVKLF